MVVSLAVNVVGNIVYSLGNDLATIVIGRLLAGAGFGIFFPFVSMVVCALTLDTLANIGVARAVFTACPDKKVQKQANVIMTGCIALGYAVGPCMLSTFSHNFLFVLFTFILQSLRTSFPFHQFTSN